MIELEPLSEEAIAGQAIELSDLWMVKLDDQYFGPFETNTLKAYAAQNAEQMADAEVTTMANEAWVLYLQSPLRPAKKKDPPKLVSATTLSKKNSYHYERHGHRHGPHAQADIAKLLAEGQLLPTDLVSDDEGLTWNKLYQMKEFEVRPHKAEQLPFAPADETLGRSHAEALQSLMEENPLEEGLVSLAYYGHRKAGTALKLEEVNLPKEASTPVIKAPPRSWWIGGGAAATAALALMIYWAQAPAPQNVELVLDEEASVMEDASAGTSLLNNGNSPRRLRAPASVPNNRFNSPGAMTDTRRDLMDYRESHNSLRDHDPAPEPMDADPYAADSQMVQNDGLVRQPAEAGDDGYRMEEPAPGDTGPVVEEVGDF